MQILWVWILPHLGNQEDRKVTLKGKTNFSPCKRKRQQSSEATRALSVGLLMVSNWRNVIHQPPGAPAWLPTLPLEPSWACPFNHKLPALSTQNSGPPALLTTQDYCTCADGSAHTGGCTTTRKASWGPRLTIHLSKRILTPLFYVSPQPLRPTAVPLVQEPLKNGDDVLVPVYPGAQHSPWHSQDLQNARLFIIWCRYVLSTSPSGSLRQKGAVKPPHITDEEIKSELQVIWWTS